MWHLFLDASALAKRYVPEKGSDTMDYLVQTVPTDRLVCLRLGAGEVSSILTRRRNAGVFGKAAFAQAQDSLRRDVILSSGFSTLPIANSEIVSALPFLQQYALNITDAVLLRIALDIQAGIRPFGDDLALVASDHGLLRAAKAEGLSTFNPETQTAQELDALLAS